MFFAFLVFTFQKGKFPIFSQYLKKIFSHLFLYWIILLCIWRIVLHKVVRNFSYIKEILFPFQHFCYLFFTLLFHWQKIIFASGRTFWSSSLFLLVTFFCTLLHLTGLEVLDLVILGVLQVQAIFNIFDKIKKSEKRIIFSEFLWYTWYCMIKRIWNKFYSLI